MSRPLLWLRSWWLSHDKWQVLGLVDPVVNSHLRIVIMTIHSFYIHIISQRLSLSFLSGTVLGISLFIIIYFMSLLDYLICLYRASTVPSRVLATGFSLKKKKEMVGGQQCWCYWLHLLSVMFFCLDGVYILRCSWYCFLSIYHVEVHIYCLISRQIKGLSSLEPCRFRLVMVASFFV